MVSDEDKIQIKKSIFNDHVEILYNTIIRLYPDMIFNIEKHIGTCSETLLLLAINQNNYTLVKFCLEKGIDLKLESKNYFNDAIKMNLSKEILEILIRYGAKTNIL